MVVVAASCLPLMACMTESAVVMAKKSLVLGQHFAVNGTFVNSPLECSKDVCGSRSIADGTPAKTSSQPHGQCDEPCKPEDHCHSFDRKDSELVMHDRFAVAHWYENQVHSGEECPDR